MLLRPLEDLKLLQVVEALLQHARDVKQLPSFRQIATMLGISYEQASSRFWTAWRLGYIEFDVHAPFEIQEIARLEPLVRETYRERGLRKCVLVAGKRGITDTMDPTTVRQSRRIVERRLAKCAAQYLDKYVAEAGALVRQCGAAGPRIGVDGGRTLRRLGAWLSEDAPNTFLQTVEVVPIVGNLSVEHPKYSAHRIAAVIAEAFGGRAMDFPLPAFVARGANVLIQLPETQAALRNARACAAVLTTVDALDDQVRLSHDGDRNRELLASVRTPDAIGVLGVRPFDKRGQAVSLPAHDLAGLTIAEMRAMVRDAKHEVIAIVGGDSRCFAPLRVALENGLISTLITDTHTARALVNAI